MARWRLTASHYLYVTQHPFFDRGEWEYTETDRVTGRQARKRYKVPVELDVKAEGAWNYPGEGIIVSNRAEPAHPRDIVFEGEPTFDMEPLDDEARKLSAHALANRRHPIEGLPTNFTPGDFSASLLSYLEQQVTAAQMNQQTQPVSLRGADNAILARLEALEKQNAELQAQLAGGSRPPEDDDPLPPADEDLAPELPLNPPPLARPRSASRRV